MSKVFLFSVKHSTPEGHLKLQGLRLAIRKLNRVQEEKYRVVVQPIKGKRNENRWKYRPPANRRWRLEDAKYVNVFLKKK